MTTSIFRLLLPADRTISDDNRRRVVAHLASAAAPAVLVLVVRLVPLVPLVHLAGVAVEHGLTTRGYLLLAHFVPIVLVREGDVALELAVAVVVVRVAAPDLQLFEKLLFALKRVRNRMRRRVAHMTVTQLVRAIPVQRWHFRQKRVRPVLPRQRSIDANKVE